MKIQRRVVFFYCFAIKQIIKLVGRNTVLSLKPLIQVFFMRRYVFSLEIFDELTPCHDAEGLNIIIN